MTIKCNACWDTGFLRCVADRHGQVQGGLCVCPMGRAVDRELEAQSMNVCPCCGRPGAFDGCPTCAAAADAEYEFSSVGSTYLGFGLWDDGSTDQH